MNETCFAYIGKCTALSVKTCPKKCSFYKTRDKHISDSQRASNRIQSLGTGNRVYIAEKYYGGNLPQTTKTTA